MEAYNIADFVSYFGTHYPWLVPTILAVAIAIGCLLDGIRVGLLGYADDWEGDYPLKFFKYVNSLLPDLAAMWSLESAGNGKYYVKNLSGRYRSNSEDYWWSDENKHSFCQMSKEDAEKLLEGTVEHQRPTDDTLGLIGGYLLLMCLGLTAYKFLPSITIGCLVAFGVLRIARTVVRLSKKLKKHIIDPNAHKTGE